MVLVPQLVNVFAIVGATCGAAVTLLFPALVKFYLPRYERRMRLSSGDTFDSDEDFVQYVRSLLCAGQGRTVVCDSACICRWSAGIRCKSHIAHSWMSMDVENVCCLGSVPVGLQCWERREAVEWWMLRLVDWPRIS